MGRIPFLLLFILLYSVSFGLLAEELIIEPEEGDQPVIRLINQAKSSVKLAMYGMTSPRLIHPLIQSNKNNKAVIILLQREPYQSKHENAYAISQLKKAKINLNLNADKFHLVHEKMLLIDRMKALVMTFNFTHMAFEKERNFGLLIDDPAMLAEIEAVFDADVKHQPIAVHHPDLIWSPNNSREKILKLIKDAKYSLKIYAQSITDYQVVGALADAAHRGVQVEIITSLNDKTSRSKQLQFLTRNGVIIYNNQQHLVHAKVFIMDDALAVIGSINLTRHSLNNNRELAVISHNAETISKLNQFFRKDAKPYRKIPCMLKLPTSLRSFLKSQNIHCAF